MDSSATHPQSQSPTIQSMPTPPQPQLQAPVVAHVIQVPVGQQVQFSASSSSSSSSPNINHQTPRPMAPMHILPPNAHALHKPGQIQQVHVPVPGRHPRAYAGGPTQQIFVSPPPGKQGQQHAQMVQVQPRHPTPNQPMMVPIGQQVPRPHMPMQGQGPRPSQPPPRIVHALPQGTQTSQFQPRPLHQYQPQEYRQLQPLQPGMSYSPAGNVNESKKVTPIMIGTPAPLVQKILVQNPQQHPNVTSQPQNQGQINVIIGDNVNGTRVFTPVHHQPQMGMYQLQKYHAAGHPSHFPQYIDQNRQQKLEEAAQAKMNKKEEKERLKAEKEKIKREKKEAAEKAKKEKQERDRLEKEKSLCPHGKQTSKCPTCRGPKKAMCPHGRQKSQCKDCGGSAICPHGRRKVICRDCGGTSICPHNRQKATCKECGGSAICIHARQKFQCRECGGSAICKHGKPKPYCKECGGSAICKHDKNKYTCPECKKETTGYAPRQKKHASNLKGKKAPTSKNVQEAMISMSTGSGGVYLMDGGAYADSVQGVGAYGNPYLTTTTHTQMQMQNNGIDGGMGGMGGMENLLNSAEFLESAGQNIRNNVLVQQVGGVDMTSMNENEVNPAAISIIDSQEQEFYQGVGMNDIPVQFSEQHMMMDADAGVYTDVNADKAAETFNNKRSIDSAAIDEVSHEYDETGDTAATHIDYTSSYSNDYNDQNLGDNKEFEDQDTGEDSHDKFDTKKKRRHI